MNNFTRYFFSLIIAVCGMIIASVFNWPLLPFFIGGAVAGLILLHPEMNRNKELAELEQRIKERRVAELKYYAAERAKGELHHLTIETDVPSKWRIFDVEKNKAYVFQDGALVDANKIYVNT